jgi:hypothetical protein
MSFFKNMTSQNLPPVNENCNMCNKKVYLGIDPSTNAPNCLVCTNCGIRLHNTCNITRDIPAFKRGSCPACKKDSVLQFCASPRGRKYLEKKGGNRRKTMRRKTMRRKTMRRRTKRM